MDVVVVRVDGSLLRPIRPPRWRPRRPGLWACRWLGRHYATARRRPGGWMLAIFSPPGVPWMWGPFPSLRAIRREFADGGSASEWLPRPLAL